MPVNFLSPEQITQYGHYAGEPTPTQLAKYFHLDDGDRQIITALGKPHTQLGFAVQLGTVRFLGTFLTDLMEVPDAVIKHMAGQLHIDVADWSKYGKRSQRRHKKKIRRLYRYEDFHKSQIPFALLRQLYARASLTQERHLVLFDYATAWLAQHKVLLPGARTLERWVARIVSRAQQRIWQRLVNLVTEPQRNQLQSLLIISKGERFSRLELLRRPATRASSPMIKHSLQRLENIRAVGVSDIDLTGISIGHTKAMARYGRSAWAAALEDLGENHRLAVLLVTTHELEAVIQDEALDLFLLNVGEKFKNAEKAGIKARLKALAQVDMAALQLSIACQFVLDKKLSGKEVRQAIFQEISREDLEKAVALVNQETSIHAPRYYNLLTDGYRSMRLFLPMLLKTIAFKGISTSDDILSAWQFLYQLDHSRPRPDMQTAPQEVVSSSAWRAVVYDQEKQIDRRYYTFCVLQTLIAALERRDIFIAPSHRWQDQRAQLLQGETWKKARPQICAALGKTADGKRRSKRWPNNWIPCIGRLPNA